MPRSPRSNPLGEAATRAATTKSIPFLATGGRHGCTTTLGKLHEGLAIDLSKLNQIRIRDGHVTVGLGVLFQDVIGPILEAGYEMQAVGSCEPLRRNFGVITSATYKLTEAPNGGRVFTADLMYGASQMTKYFDALKGLEDTMPAELAINIAITWDATANEARFDIGSFNSAYKTFDAFYYKAYPNGRSSAGVLESFSNQAVAAVPTDATAYPWKASKGNLC
ncbi:putative FAD-binding PCMH-type domain-containing protein [Seiridium unicorne]|uniref:FAD-binding PCMH-type domain-containing protein n=1 Tax=Seiridium unicorne TaxID=138068 RepID=A0ABR2VE54_9PEZI